jgi:hypothetical protein
MHPLDSPDGELSASELAPPAGIAGWDDESGWMPWGLAGIRGPLESDGDRRVKSLRLTEAGLDAIRPVWPVRRMPW